MLIDVVLFFRGLGDIIGSFVAISEVMLVILDFDLDSFLEFGKMFAQYIPKKQDHRVSSISKMLKYFVRKSNTKKTYIVA